MKFEYSAAILENKYFPEYHFYFILTEDEVRESLHKRGYNSDNMHYFMNDFRNLSIPEDYKIFASTELIRDTLSSEEIDLGIDYKKKYEELVDLLEPHKIDDMPPETTLKMILKYTK
jgi:hypothetical protein